MAQQNLPSAPANKMKSYNLLFGVDYSRDVTDTDARRSPDMVNMISDLGGNPIKRDGYRAVALKYDGIAYVQDKILGVRALDTMLRIYEIMVADREFTETVITSVTIPCGEVNKVLSFRQYLIVLTNEYVVRYNVQSGETVVQGVADRTMSSGTLGSSAPSFDSDEIIPTVSIGLNPDGTGGNSYYGKNLFSIYQRASYLSDKHPVYKKDADGKPTTEIDHYEGSKEYVIPAYKKVGSWIKVEVRDSETGEWATMPSSSYTLSERTTVKGYNLKGNASVDCTIMDGKITFGELPPEPVIAGQDNIRITYAPFSMEEVESGSQTVYRGYFNQILLNLLASDSATIFSQRLVIADGSRVYYSNTSVPLLLDDNMWFEVDNPVMCFARVNSSIGVITKDVGVNTIYLAAEETKVVNSETGETDTYFVVKPSNAGVGAISPRCNGTLNDEPVFLSATGVYGMLSNYTSEKYAVNRTSRINRRLCKEPNLETAVGVSFNSYFYICINTHMYVVDGRHRDSSRNGESSYECYYFEGMPNITDMYVINNRMYFTDGVYLYTWNSDLADTERYADYKQLDGAVGEPVCAKWSSCLDDDGAPHLVKTLQKKGSHVTLTPHYETGAELTLCKDGEDYIYVGEYRASLSTFDRITFENFSFKSSGQVVDAFMKKKSKKYRRLQIILENNKAEPFGITNVVKVYQVGDLAKPKPAFSKKRG